jgi:uncharacterized protein YdhG (YjbR/CyaY superfamily)
MTKPATVDQYLETLSGPARDVMADLRATVRSAAPEAVETIAYDMPALRLNGHFLVSYAAYRRHYSLFPASQVVEDALGAEIAPFLAGKGTIQFPVGRPVPLDLVRRVVVARVGEVAQRTPRDAR